MLYAITITEAELDVVRLALGRMLEPRKVAAPKPKTTAVPPEFATGNDALDAFMRRSWKPADRVAAARRASVGMPSAKSLVFPFGLKQLTSKPARADVRRFNDEAVGAWRRLGYEVKVERLDSSPSGHEVALDGRNVTITRAGA